MYDYLIVGAGLFGATFAYEAMKHGKKCLVVDKRSHIAGTAYTYYDEGICVHKYGAHIFRTDDKEIWDFVNQFAEFNRFTNCPVAKYGNKVYNLPFNMNTFYQMYGATTPEEAIKCIERDKIHFANPKNLEEYCLSTVGKKIYKKLIKEYTEKQWGRPCTEIAPDVMTLPLRFTYDNNYFNEKYQGVPIGGYTAMVEKMLKGADLCLSFDYSRMYKVNEIVKKVIHTGRIDEYFGYCFGSLEYRSLEWKRYTIYKENLQGNAVVNYTDKRHPYTRIIEHKHFENNQSPVTIITEEYPCSFGEYNEPFYPINNKENQGRYERYKRLSKDIESRILFGGWCGTYSNDTMDTVIRKALDMAKAEFGGM